MSEIAVKPFTPEDVERTFNDNLPDFVIEAVNELLAENFSGKGISIRLQQDDIVKRIMEKGEIKEREEVFEKHYLDFEALYRKNGWKVTYDKPGYNETYEAYFEFKPQA